MIRKIDRIDKEKCNGSGPKTLELARADEVGSGGLQRKADRHPSKQQLSECDAPSHGRPLLRRSGNGRKKSPSAQRKIHPMAGRNDRY